MVLRAMLVVAARPAIQATRVMPGIWAARVAVAVAAVRMLRVTRRWQAALAPAVLPVTMVMVAHLGPMPRLLPASAKMAVPAIRVMPVQRARMVTPVPAAVLVIRVARVARARMATLALQVMPVARVMLAVQLAQPHPATIMQRRHTTRRRRSRSVAVVRMVR